MPTAPPMTKPHIMGIDIETFSSAPLPKCGVYRYADAPDFAILLFSYAFDDDPVVTIDLACGEELPPDVVAALEDHNTLKFAYNAQFERVCLSKHLGHWLDPHQWRCTAVWAAYSTMPARLADAAVALGVNEKKMEEGKDLIRYFSVPCKATKTNGGRTRNLPSDSPEKWATYKAYNAQDVVTERAVRKALESNPLPELEWALYALDQLINDRGVRVDKLLVKQAMAVDSAFSEQAFQRAKELTGLDNPGSVAQLKQWLADQDIPMESLAKKIVQEKAKTTEGIAGELLSLRLELSKTSVKKYEAVARTVCRDGRVHGLLQFFGASRTGRWCLTGDHEVLTKHGWVRLDEWSGGSIACWNASTEAISFQPANALSFPYSGTMYHYADQRIDQISTPDHRMRLKRGKGGPWVTDTVENMVSCRPCIPIYGYGKKIVTPSSRNLRVLVMVQADGHYTTDGSLRLHFSKERKIARCRRLLRDAGIEYSVSTLSTTTQFTIPFRKLPLWLRMFRDKTFGMWLLEENPDVFFEELTYWDGCKLTATSSQYSTNNRVNADIIQAFAHLSGRTAVILKKTQVDGDRHEDHYRVNICDNLLNCHEVRSKPIKMEFDGTVYCAETQTGFFMVRRNGKVWVTGNSGRLAQIQNLPQNHLPDLELARSIVKTGNEKLLEMLFGSVPNTLSELIRTAFIPKEGHRFIEADFSAIEARVLAWLAGEEWVLEEFRGKGKIYEATASRMFHIPQNTIVKGNPNYEYRQKGKQATLSCIAEGIPVLTDHGLVPIEQVRRSHLVWDGDCWVQHDGVIYRGVRKCVSYAGLVATPDHLVWNEGQWMPFIETLPNGTFTLEPHRVYDILNCGPNHCFVAAGRKVHNCGYGGGVGALKAMGAKMPEEEMQPLVDAWRAANPRIVAFWYALGNAASEVIKKHNCVRVGKVTVYWQHDRMYIQLPAGRRLCYLSPRFVPNRFGGQGIGFMAPGPSGQMALQETFGGKLAENVTQSIARDLLAHGMLQLEKAGYPIVFHVHDEAVMEVPIGFGSVEEACRIMAIQPEWARDLPLRADGDEMAFYQKS